MSVALELVQGFWGDRSQLVGGLILFGSYLRRFLAVTAMECSCFKLIFLDQFEQEISVQAELFMEQRAKRTRGGVRRRSGL